MTTNLNEIKQQISSIEARLTDIEKTVNSVSEFQKTFDVVTDSVQEVKANVCKTNEGLADVVDDMNNRMRRNNLIIKGLPEEENEGYARSESVVREFFRPTLKWKLETLREPID